LKQNKDGFFYFCDRVGDTFRWKSENVATTEVAQALGVYPGITEANVYGTLVPEHDGRAGMAALVLEEGTTLDFNHLCEYLRQKLPKYAVPLFIRFTPSLNITGTFKQQKVELRNQGIDLSKIPETDAVFWLKGDTYVPFTVEDYAHFESGKVKL
jgi:acyl-CoA synthetase (AMP-forming)/AMP-acid ligase II